MEWEHFLKILWLHHGSKISLQLFDVQLFLKSFLIISQKSLVFMISVSEAMLHDISVPSTQRLLQISLQMCMQKLYLYTVLTTNVLRYFSIDVPRSFGYMSVVNEEVWWWEAWACLHFLYNFVWHAFWNLPNCISINLTPLNHSIRTGKIIYLHWRLIKTYTLLEHHAFAHHCLSHIQSRLLKQISGSMWRICDGSLHGLLSGSKQQRVQRVTLFWPCSMVHKRFNEIRKTVNQSRVS